MSLNKRLEAQTAEGNQWAEALEAMRDKPQNDLYRASLRKWRWTMGGIVPTENEFTIYVEASSMYEARSKAISEAEKSYSYGYGIDLMAIICIPSEYFPEGQIS